MKETPIPHVPVAIVGGGQAGLSVAFQLHKKGIESVVFERREKFHSWRVNRWDSFCLVTPNWQCRLPGFHYDKEYGGTDPDGFMLRDEITAYLDAFAATFGPGAVGDDRLSCRDGGSGNPRDDSCDKQPRQSAESHEAAVPAE